MFSKIILVSAAVSTAIIAGLFFAWSFSVMNGLAKLSDKQFVASMQSMNREIQNPVFFTFFFGAAILLPVASYLQYNGAASMVFWFAVSGTVLYLIGVMGITIFGNVPLNNMLEAFQLPQASPEEISAQRTRFERPWVNLNYVRTAASFFSIIFLVLACLYYSDES